MKQYIVYELVDQYNTIVYIGCTGRTLKARLREHIRSNCKSPGHGKFLGRTDLIIRPHSVYDTRKEALLIEGSRKLELGFEWIEHHGKNGKKSCEVHNSKIYTCQCGQIIRGPSYYYHIKKCKRLAATI